MPLAIFNISNSTLNLAISLAIFVLVVIWLAMVVYTFLDARRRIEDPFLIGCATVASLFPLVGTAVYAILRPPELLADAHERDLEIEAAEMRVRHLKAQSCAHCGYPVERNFMRCPSCERRLKDPCTSCERPVDPRWSICPYCETALPGRRRETRSGKGQSRSKSSASKRGEASRGSAAERADVPRGSEAEGARDRSEKPRRADGTRNKETSRAKPATTSRAKPATKRAVKSSGDESEPVSKRAATSGRAPNGRRDR